MLICVDIIESEIETIMGLSFITLLPTMICGLWSVVLFLDILENGDRGSHRKLLLWSTTATVLYLCHTFYFAGDRKWAPIFDSIYVACNLAVFPLYLRYLLYLTEGRVSKTVNAVILIPPVVCGLIVAALYILMGDAERRQFIDTYLYVGSHANMTGLQLAQFYMHSFCKSMFAVGVVLTMVIGMKKARRYNQIVDSIYSDIEDKRIHDITKIFIFMALTCIISFAVNIFGRHIYVDSVLLLSIPFVCFTILLFAIAYTGYCQKFSYSDMLPYIHNVEVELPDTDIHQRGIKELSESISYLMQTEHSFLIPNLKVDDLANMLGSNSRYVQRALNEDMGMSFAEFVNRQRVDFAVHLMNEHPNLNMAEISSRSGFSSMSAFYRNMKMYG